ncbi:MAG TPA: hypothetical protein VHV99_14405 [Paraburkholderia sp.]|nr:hypothetical protein [Paraburkholderia sp.]
MTTVWVGDVDHLRPGCFSFYCQNASTFASLHGTRARAAHAGRRGAFYGDGPQRLARRASGQAKEKMYPILKKK